MSTSFEFLPRPARRIRVFWILPAILGGLLGVAGLGALFLRSEVNRLHDRFEQDTRTLDSRKQELVTEGLALIPDAGRLADLELRILEHNQALIGPRISWTRLLKALEGVLPEESVIISILNGQTGKASFGPDDRQLAFTVLVADVTAANEFYRKLSGIPEFQGLAFTPHGEMTWQSRKGTAIDVAFSFVEGGVR